MDNTKTLHTFVASNKQSTPLAMKNFIIILTAALFSNLSFAGTFYFTGNEDADYMNEANWSPSFPGKEISAEDKIYVQSDMNFEGFDITIKGLFDVSLGVTIFSSENAVIVEKNGTFVNNGEINVAKIETAGRLDNSAAAQMFAKTCVLLDGAVFNNMMGAKFGANELFNNATFNNYSLCTINTQFVNKSNVNLYANANLNITGKLEAYTNSNIQQTAKAKMFAASTSNVSNSSYSGMMQGLN